MGLGDLYSDTASYLGYGLEWYALPRGGELDTETDRPIDDGRIVFALLHALRIQADAYPNDFEPLIAAAVAGEMQPLEAYCATIGDDPEWPGIVRATVTTIAALRRTFDPLREELQPLRDAYLTEHQRAAQQHYEDFIRKHGRMRS
jgi:hypothetical protein